MDDPVNFEDKEKATTCCAFIKVTGTLIADACIYAYYGVERDWETTEGKYKKNP